MENKIKLKNKNGEIRIITDKQRNSEYTFVDDGLTNHLPNSSPNHSNDYNLPEEQKKREGKNDMSSYSIRRHSDKLRRNSTDYMRFKSSKITKAQSKQNHSPVYE
jgi:hypothetical protein